MQFPAFWPIPSNVVTLDAGVHVIMWGQVDTANNVLDMTLGIPADTLAATGIKSLPRDYVLPVPVTGTPQSPNVNWSRYVLSLKLPILQ